MVFGAKKNKVLVEEVERLQRALEELSILNDLARAISTSFETESIVSTVVRRSVKAIGAEQASITMVNSDEMVPDGTIVHVQDTEKEHYHLSHNLLGLMAHEKAPVLINDVAADRRLRHVPLSEGVRNLICVPMMSGTQVIGVLSAYNKLDSAGFNEDDQRLLAIISAQSAQVLERARLLEEEKAAEELRRDVLMAEKIQLGLLPQDDPQVPGYDMAGSTTPARLVGGDYYDFIDLGDRRWAIALGDVSGKGLPASLLMANLQATLRGQAFLGNRCHDCMAWCNRLLFRNTPLDKFVTLFYGQIDTRSHVMTYCNAGHEQPFLFTESNGLQRLTTGGLAVGILEEFAYEDAIIHVHPGDILVIFSDGVTDMVNENEEPFGEDRLCALLEQTKDQPAAEMIAAVHKDLAEFAGKMPPFDDVTLVVVKRDPDK